MVPGAQEIVAGNAGGKNDALELRIANARRKAAGQPLFHVHDQIDLIVAARHTAGIDVHRLDIGQTLQPYLRAVDQLRRVHTAFHLTHLAA